MLLKVEKPCSVGLSVLDPIQIAGGLSSTAPAEGNLYLERTKHECKGDQ